MILNNNQNVENVVSVFCFLNYLIVGQVGMSFKYEYFLVIMVDGKFKGFFEVYVENYMGVGGLLYWVFEVI